MMSQLFLRIRTSVLGLITAALACAPAAAQVNSAFTYQGDLQNAGVPANGNHDLTFRLFPVNTGGTQVGPSICLDNVPITAGRFSVRLDFGSVFDGSSRFLEISVRSDTGLNCTSTVGLEILSPRQEVTAAPYAAYALNSGSVDGQPSSFYRNASNLNAGTLPSARLSGLYSNAVSLTSVSNSFTGSGAGLTALNASNLSTGLIPSARLPATVARTDTANTFTQSQTFNAGIAIPTTSRSFFADSTAFIPSNSSILYSNDGGPFAATNPAGTFIKVYAPVQLPPNANVTGMSLTYFDDSPTRDMTARLVRDTLPINGFTFIATVATSGTPGGVLTATTTASHTVPSGGSAYFIEVEWTTPPGAERLWLYGVIINYTISQLR